MTSVRNISRTIPPSGNSQFSGFYRVLIDAKRRFCVPSAFRRTLQRDIVLVTIEITTFARKDRIIAIYNKGAWKTMLANLTEQTSRENFLRGSFQASVDNQGRILIPNELSEFFCISPGDQIIVAGTGNSLQLWKKENWLTRPAIQITIGS